MGLTIIFTGADGQSHFREAELQPGGPTRRPISPRHAAAGWEITETPAGYRSAFGTTRAPRTLVILEGELEMTVGNGVARVFRPGDVIHATDTEGAGHSSAVPGSRPCRVLNILSVPDPQIP